MSKVGKAILCSVVAASASFVLASNYDRGTYHTTSDGWVWQYTDTDAADSFFDETTDGVRHCNGSAQIVDYVGEGGNVIVPSEVAYSDDEWDCKAVIRGIAGRGTVSSAFGNYRDRVTGLVIADTVKWIGKHAFNGGGQLETVTVSPDSQLQILGMDCFNSCRKLRTLTLSSTNLYRMSWNVAEGCTNLQEVMLEGDGTLNIEDGMFKGCTALRKVKLGKGVKAIQRAAGSEPLRTNCPTVLWPTGGAGEREPSGGAFEGCSNLSEINIDNIEEIGYDVFRECSSLSNVVFSSNLTQIGDYAFSGCTSLCKVVFSSALTRIGSYAFSGCTSLCSVNLEDAALINLDSGAFGNCSSLQGIVIPSTVTDIQTSAFGGCTSLKSVVLPVGLKSIGHSAFASCAITELVIPDTVETLAWQCFCNCPISKLKIPAIGVALHDILTDRNKWSWDMPVEDVEITPGTGVVPDNFNRCYCDAYGTENNVHLTNVVIHSGVTTIGNRAFCACTNLVTISIPNTVEKIGTGSFQYCSSLTGIVLPESVNELGSSAFQGAVSLEKFSTEGKICNIGLDTFRGCSVLKEVVLPSTITNIGDYAFSWCSSLKGIELPDELRTVGKSAFNNSGFTNLTFKSKVGRIDDSLGWNCDSLEKIVFESDSMVLGSSASVFIYGPNLKALVFKGKYAPRRSTGYFNHFFGDYPYVSSDFVVYVKPGSTGWDGVSGSQALPEMWPVKFDSQYGRNQRRITFIPMTLSFDFRGGEGEIAEVTRTPREALDALPCPSRSGYTFVGWSLEKENGAIQTSESLVPDESTTLYAQWVEGTWTYSVENGGSVIGDGETCAVSPSLSGEVALPEYLGGRIVTRIADRAFADCSGLTAVTVPSVDIGENVFANCRDLERIVFYEDAPTNCSANFLAGTTADAVVYVKAGTKGWDGNWESDALPISGTWPEGANGRRISYDYVDVSFDAGEGEVEVPQSALIARSPYGPLPVPTWEGHTFVGWFTQTNGENLVTADSVVPDDAETLYAHWVDGVWTYSVSDGKVTLGNGTDCAVDPLPTGDLVIPKWLGGFPVTALAAQAFAGCTGLASVDVPCFVAQIGDRAFAGCTSLLAVSYRSSSIELEGTDLYEGTPSELVSKVYRMSHGWDGTVTEPCSLPSNWPQNSSCGRAVEYLPIVVTYDPCGGWVSPSSEEKFTRQEQGELPTPYRSGYYTFLGWFTDRAGGSLVTAESTVPDGHTTLYAHWDDHRWTYTVVDGLVVIGTSSYYSAVVPRTSERLVVPDYLGGYPVVSLSQYALYGLSAKEIVLPSSVTNIGLSAVGSCRQLTNIVLSANLETIGNAAFYGCSVLETCDIPSGVRMIPASCFSSCTNLQSVVLSDSVTNVAQRAFYNCYSLKEVEIGRNCTVLGNEIFGSCTSLVNVTFSGNAPQTVGIGIYTNTPNTMVTTVPAGSMGWNGDILDATLPEQWPVDDVCARGITDRWIELRYEAGAGNISEPVVFLPSRQKMGELPVPTRSGSYAFIGWFTQPEGGELVTNESIVPNVDITLYAHWDAHRWYHTVVDGKAVIGRNGYVAVYPTTSEDLVVPDYLQGFPVVSLSQYALYGVAAKTVVLPQTVTNIGDYAFLYCRQLTNIVFSSSLKTLGGGAFALCGSLERLELPSGVINISASCFVSCTNLKQVTFSEGVTNIGISAFSSCRCLGEVEIGSQCQSIGARAFSGCTSLTNVLFRGNAPSNVGVGIYTNTPAALVTRVQKGSVGWNGAVDETALPVEWPIGDVCARSIKHLLGADPIPELYAPTEEAVRDVLADAEDPKLAEKITNETEYVAFREWSGKVQPHGGGDAVGAAGVMAAPNAWVSYALGSEMLLETAPTDVDLTVEAFEPKSGEDGKFDFTVSVEGVEVGGAATTDAQMEQVKENLKQIFGLEGGASLEEGEMSSANVDITFGTPQNGKVKFTAGPKDTGAKTFFMKVKVNQ